MRGRTERKIGRPHSFSFPGVVFLFLLSLSVARAQIDGGGAANEAGYTGLPVDAAKPVAVHILSPEAEATLPDNEVDAFVSVDNYRLAEDGNRLEFILDNRPPAPLATLAAPAIFKHLSEGGHTLRVAAVKPDGHVLTNPEAFAMVHFFVRRRDFQNYIDPDRPFLTIFLPAGGSVTPGADNRVWLDFLLHNAPLAKDGFRVRYRINQAEGFQYEDKPVYWENLKPGRYELTVELLDANLQPVPGFFNPVSRTFSVEAPVKAIPVTVLPAEPAAPAPASAGPPPPSDPAAQPAQTPAPEARD